MKHKRREIYVNTTMTREDLENSALAISDVAMDALEKHVKEHPPKSGDNIELKFLFRFR